jgi:hypothetical protein
MFDWDAAIARLRTVVDKRPSEYAPETIANATDVLRLAMERNWPMPELGAGYWPTVCIWWQGRAAPDLEVFASSIEVYRTRLPNFDMRDYDHTPGQTFPPEFVAEFSRLDR